MIKDTFKLKHRGGLKVEDRQIQLGWFGIANDHFPHDRGLHPLGETQDAYGSICKIEAEDGTAVYRAIRSAGNNQIGKNDLLLDYQGRLDLIGSGKGQATLTIKRAQWYERWGTYLWYHPDPSFEMARRATFASVILGAFSLALGVMSVVT
jgi:hypothetical protein